MASTDIVLSICIPTFNRAPQLQQTLESIVRQPAFADSQEVEVVISDNASDDETQAVAARFVEAWPGKVRYHRFAETVTPEMNFKTVLQHGQGIYLKLHNDNLMVMDGGLTEMLRVIRATSAEMPVIFFTNGSHAQENTLEVLTSMDDFVRRVSFMSTWIGGFGMWRTEFLALADFDRHQQTRLVQTDVLLRLLGAGKRAVVLYGVYFTSADVGLPGKYKKGGYNYAEVFGRHYLSLLKPYLAAGILDREIYEQEKKALLRHIIRHYFFTSNGYEKTGFFAHMQDYVDDDYFYASLQGLEHDVPAWALAPTPGKTFEQKKREHWRASNMHNQTELTQSAGLLEMSTLSAGRRASGSFSVQASGCEGEGLRIGHFVSLAGTHFILGGCEPVEGISTFPFLNKYFGERVDTVTRGAITVSDDVWIGPGVTVLPGVTIGQGAIVEAGSVVSTDVAPYAVVGGNPATLVRYRYPPEIVERLGELDYDKVSDAAILANRALLRAPLTVESAEVVVKTLMAAPA